MNKTNQVIDFIKSCKHRYGTTPFLKLPDNESALSAVETYLQYSDRWPLIVLGPAGSGKTHLVGSAFSALKDDSPQLSFERLIHFCSMQEILPFDLDCAAIAKSFKTIFIDSIDFALSKTVSDEWLIFLEEVSQMGCKVICTATDLYDWSNRSFQIIEISMSFTGRQQLAPFFFFKTFGRSPLTDEEFALCANASKEGSFRVIQGRIKSESLRRHLEDRGILWGK